MTVQSQEPNTHCPQITTASGRSTAVARPFLDITEVPLTVVVALNLLPPQHGEPYDGIILRRRADSPKGSERDLPWHEGAIITRQHRRPPSIGGRQLRFINLDPQTSGVGHEGIS